MKPQSQIAFLAPFWGQSHLSAPEFLHKVMDAGFDGIEIDMPASGQFIGDFLQGIASIRSVKNDFVFIAQQVLPPATESVDEYILRMKNRLRALAELKPDFINSHTGKDYFSFDENCRVIEAAMHVSETTGVQIFHETHRGRFSFHTASLLPYLQKFPEMELVGDISHFCTVSESMLEDQQVIIEKILPHISHIHARVGHEQAPQVNDPFAPEWKHHVEIFMSWWKKVIDMRIRQGKPVTITPEFGPSPYMPELPYTRAPTVLQWPTNVRFRDFLKNELTFFP